MVLKTETVKKLFLLPVFDSSQFFISFDQFYQMRLVFDSRLN